MISKIFNINFGFRLSLALTYILFGIPKLIEGCSPATNLICAYFQEIATILNIDPAIFVYFVGLQEIFLGVGVLIFARTFSTLILFHMMGTLGSFYFVQDQMFVGEFLSMEGQYVFKNIFIILACLSILGEKKSKKKVIRTRVIKTAKA